MPLTRPEETVPYWAHRLSMPPCAALGENIETDVCIVGAGIGGLSTAYLLAREGKRVVVLEDYEIGSGQTGRSTAHLTCVLDTRYQELLDIHGAEKLRVAVESHVTAMNRIETIVFEEGIDCSYGKVDGFLFLDPESSIDLLDREMRAAQELGVGGVDWVERAPLGSFETGVALRFAHQSQLDPFEYSKGLAQAILRMGGKIFTHTRVSEVVGGENAHVTTREGFLVKAQSVVVATNSPINDRFAIHTKQAPYRTYVIGIRVPKGSISAGLYWDTAEPYHYLRIQPAQADEFYDLLLVGGEDHKTGQNDHPEHCFQALEDWARTRFHELRDVAYKWSGQVMEPVDGLAFIGHNPMDSKNVYVITGHSGNGTTYGTIGGLLITDQIMGRANPWEEIYAPGRVTMRTAGEFIKENANVLAQYADWFGGESLKAVAELAKDEGVVVQSGLKKLAAYKDPLGQIHVCSAVCPHLGGIVHWNTIEKSWDCPCHGSRFDARGTVIEGPASKDLDKGALPPAEPAQVPSRSSIFERSHYVQQEEF